MKREKRCFCLINLIIIFVLFFPPCLCAGMSTDTLASRSELTQPDLIVHSLILESLYEQLKEEGRSLTVE